MICHQWLSMGTQQTLSFRSLCSQFGDQMELRNDLNLKFPANMQIVRFSTLEEIRQVLSNALTYYRPKSSKFKWLDAFILDGKTHTCFGLQMTTNVDRCINARAIKRFLQWLKSV